MYTEDIIRIALEISRKIINKRREFHIYPELAFNEFETSGIITDFLNSLGLTVQTGIAGTGVSGILLGGNPGKTLVIRAEMDALPINEQSITEYTSRNDGRMHACGHDAHMAIVLGCAEILSRMKGEINGSVRFIFQPAEEGLGGARFMIEEGVLENPDASAIIAAHVWPELATGQVSILKGPAMASTSEFTIVIKGRGGHAAQPQNTVDPINIGVNLINLFQGLITREKNPVKNAVLSVTCFNAGAMSNVIPDCASIMGTVRTFDPLLDRQMSERMREITSALTKAMGADFEFTYKAGYPPVINDTALSEKAVRSFTKIINSRDIIQNPDPSMAAEDFSYYAQKIPGVIFNLGCSKPGTQRITNLHSSAFDIDEDCIMLGMKLISQFAVDFLNEENQKVSGASSPSPFGDCSAIPIIIRGE